MKATLIIVISVIIVLAVLYFVFIGNPKKPEPEIVKFNKPVKMIGLEIQTNDKDIYKDVGRVYKAYNNITKDNPIPHLRQPWAKVNISKDYIPEKGTFTYIVGDVVTKTDTIPRGLKAYEIPAITYAVFPIRPKSSIAWGITMGRMKKYIYTKWLPASGYEVSDIIGDFELHEERSLGKHPEISLYVALKEKN